MDEKQEKFVALRDFRLKEKRFLGDEANLKKIGAYEMHPDDFNLKMRAIEIDILKARGNIYSIEKELGLDKNDPETKKIEEEAFREIDSLEDKMMGIIPSVSQEKREIWEKANELIDGLNLMLGKINEKGYSFDDIRYLKDSEKQEELDFFNEMENFVETNIDKKLRLLTEEDPNYLFDMVIPKIKDPSLRAVLLESIVDDHNIYHQKIVDDFIKNFPKNSELKSFKELSESVDKRLIVEKSLALRNIPVEEAVGIIIEDPKVFNSPLQNYLAEQSTVLCETYLNQGKLEDLKKWTEKLLVLKDKVGDESIYLQDFFPGVSRYSYANYSNTDIAEIFLGNMSKRFFNECYERIIGGSFEKLVPKHFFKERVFYEYIQETHGNLTSEQIEKKLKEAELVFSDLSVEEKISVFYKSNEDGKKLFSEKDFHEMLGIQYLDIDMVPEKYHLSLKKDFINSFFKETERLSYIELSKLVNKLNFKTSDLDLVEQKIKVLNIDQEEVFDLFETKELEDLISGGILKIGTLPVNNIKRIFETTGIKMGSLTFIEKMLILNNRSFQKDIIHLLDPNDLKELCLSEKSKFETASLDNILELLNFTGLQVKDIPLEKRLYIFNHYYRFDEIKERFTVEDIKKLFVLDKSIDIGLIPQEYHEELSTEIIEFILKNEKIDFLENKERREWFFEKVKIRNHENDLTEEKVQRLSRLQESFWIYDNQEKLPESITQKFKIFQNKYGEKGKGLIALAIIAYGLENPENLVSRINKIEKILDLYEQEKIPEGMRTTLGIEYEVGNEMGEVYNQKNPLGYVIESELIGKSANIKRGGGGDGAIFEHATRATDNPYLLMVEMNLLQDSGFIDLNFKEYEMGSRGYHLNLGGETGLDSGSKDMFFLYNVFAITGLNGFKLGKEVSSVKEIYSKSLDDVFEKKQGGDRVEIKGMGCDCIEQFNKSILTAHYAGIATQVLDKYLYDSNLFTLLDKLPEEIKDFKDFLSENSLLKEDFGSNQEKEVAYAWLRFKKDILLSIREHNRSFFDAEFRGFSQNEKGEDIDTGEHIDCNLNMKRLNNLNIDPDSDEFKKMYFISEDLLFKEQEVDLANPLTRINNFFIFKEFVLEQNKFYLDKKTKIEHLLQVHMQNAYSMLSTMKKDYQVMNGSSFDSIVDQKGRIRDGYYYTQNASEEMIIHKSQIILNKFNNQMMELLVNSKVEKKLKIEEKQYERTI